MPEVIYDALTPALDEDWDALVQDSPQGSAFLRSDWLRMLAETDGARLQVLRFALRDDGGRLQAGWALPVRPCCGGAISHHFELFYAGPILAADLDSGAVRQASARYDALAALAAAVAARIDLIVAETHPALQDLRALLRGPFTLVPVYTHRRPISDLPDVWTAMNRDKRREIRRASEQLHLAEDREADAVTAFIDLHRRVVLRFGQAPTRRWAEVLRTRVAWLQARDGARLYAARDGASVRRASVLVLLSRENREAYLWRAGFDAETVGLGTIPALYWSVAEALAPPKAGAAVDATPWQWINFGGSTTTSLGRFKDYLGATPTLHFRLLHRRAGPPPWLWEGRELALRAARGLRARLASHCPPS